MILRELTDCEKKELNRFQTTGNGYQVLLGMIAVDLMQEKAYENPIHYMDYADYIKTDYYHKGDAFILMPLIETWLTKLEINNNNCINEKIKKGIFSLNICYINTICGISPGIGEKKYREMVRLFQELDQKQFDKTGQRLENCPEECYRYIVTCMEYMGLKREPSVGDKLVDLREIYYSDLSE